jgi:hypothetical protein
MKFSTGFAIILVGVAAVASAEPAREEVSGRVSYTEKRAPHSDSTWLQLATPTPAKHGTEFVAVGKDAGSFAQLRIDATAGKVALRRVRVVFEDGKQKIVDVDRVLGGRHKSAIIDLDAQKPIDRVVVTTEPYTNGQYAIYGAVVGAGVASR